MLTDPAGNRLLYVAHPRTASRATMEALKSGADFHRHVATRYTRIPRHATVGEAGLDPSRYVVFTTVRNHWDAVYSWYRHLENDGREFGVDWLEYFLREADTYLPTEGRLWDLHRRGADVVLRYERLERDLNDLLWTHGFESVELSWVSHHQEHERPEDRPHYSTYYNLEMQDAVRALFVDEIDELGYEFQDRSGDAD